MLKLKLFVDWSNGKDSANDQLQGDQRKSKVTCEYCNS